MKASDELFRLIRTLTPSEKRYFKTNAKRENATSNYLQLFEAIDAQKEYDEDKLKKKHAKKKFVKYLSAEKNYLHEQIMKQMRAFHVDRTIDNKINDLLQDEAFYRAKGLNELRRKTIEKARSLAEEYERFHLLQDTILRQVVFEFENAEKFLEEPIRELLDDMLSSQKRLSDFVELYRLRHEIFVTYRSGADFNDDSVRLMLDDLKGQVSQFETKSEGSIRLRSQYEMALSDYYNCMSEWGPSFDHLWVLYEAFQIKPSLKKEYLLRYRILLSNLCTRAFSANKEETFFDLLNELKSLPSNSFNAEGEVFQNVYFLEHLWYLSKGKLVEAESLMPAISEGLNRYASKVNKARLLSFQYNIMVMYFIMHRFKEARDWAEKILDDKSDIKQNVTTVTRILYPIIHFELGHHDLVENLTRSAYRYLLKLKRLHSFERIMVKYLQELPLSPQNEEFMNKLKELSVEFEKLRTDSNEQITAGFEELELWIRYRLEGKEMPLLL